MTRAWVREVWGWILAAAVALVTTATVAASARSELLFRDGDSLIVPMLSRSILSGERLDWAMSSVLFLPETAAFTSLDAALPVTTDALLTISAVLNLLALYGAIRLVAGRARTGSAPIAWSLAAFALFGALAMTETSASRDALELASLPLTTTYYSATVVAVVLSVGLVRRAIDRESTSAPLLVTLGLVAAFSSLSNPLFAIWATVPLGVLLAVMASRPPFRRRSLTMLSVLLGATALGMVARISFAAWIANTGTGYAQPALWRESLVYYGDLAGTRLSSPLGLLAAGVTLALIIMAVTLTVRATDPGTRLVATAAWLMPLLVVIGAIALGTHAARYLQPLAFAPVLALVARPRSLAWPRNRRALTAVGAAAAVLVLVGGALSIPRLVTATRVPDADLTCVTDWVDDSGRTGAGQFWTVRLPKLHLEDPTRFVQVDHRLNGYAWLVNRTDLAVGEVSFLVEDRQTVPWELPAGVSPDRTIACGRYTILDFESTQLPLGPAHS